MNQSVPESDPQWLSRCAFYSSAKLPEQPLHLAAHQHPSPAPANPMGTHQQAMGTHQQAMGTHQQAMGTHQQAMGTHQQVHVTFVRPACCVKSA